MKRRALILVAVLTLCAPACAEHRLSSSWNEAPAPDRTMVFGRGKNDARAFEFYDHDRRVGELRWDGGIVRFMGHADQSAAIFFANMKMLIDQQILEDRTR